MKVVIIVCILGGAELNLVCYFSHQGTQTNVNIPVVHP